LVSPIARRSAWADHDRGGFGILDLQHRNLAGERTVFLEMCVLRGEGYFSALVARRKSAQKYRRRRNDDGNSFCRLRCLSRRLKKLSRPRKSLRIHFPIRNDDGFHGEIVAWQAAEIISLEIFDIR
jgi:hypothetical protein